MELKGQTAYITGGASGLGEATARLFAAAGATVGVLDMDEDLARSVAGALGGAAAICDVTDAASHEAGMASLRAAIGPARILVACAGIATGAKLIAKDGAATPLDRLTKAIQVNLIGTINSMRLAAADMAALDPLEDGERGVIVTTSSIAGFEGQIGQGDYSASKGGVAATAITFARELARNGIRVNCISPGLMDTPMMAGLPDPVRESLIETTVYPKRLGHASEYAALAKHIAENRYINGTVIRLDGALRMAPR
ncbi:MAG: SDR family oxidoreductase [Proteobacteria bacterium]|nr:SDR family oxidoreductase [Pseudomonadota bacterium]MDA1357469.1 SDR family oxidoreductase [Pseudomonadota bacterium]